MRAQHMQHGENCSDPTLSTLHDLQAAQKPKGSIERLLLVAAFAQSAFQAVGKLKCMYPVSGETYEVGLSRSKAPYRKTIHVPYAAIPLMHLLFQKRLAQKVYVAYCATALILLLLTTSA